MKKFFTAVPLQQNGALERFRYQAIDNKRLQMERPTSFPILTAVHAFVRPEDAFQIIALVTDSPVGRKNFEVLQAQVEEQCREDGLVCPEIIQIAFPEDQNVANLAEIFLRIIDQIQDGDELFGSMTFGTKPISMALTMALQFGYRVKANVTIDCVVYGEIVREDEKRENWFGRVYDQTGLLRLGETVQLLAKAGVRDPNGAIRSFLGQ